jgi:SAM-dependent methyltransferase
MEDSWSAMAPLRREQIESGKDVTFNKVFVPFYLELVAALRCNSIVEVGCGTGHLAKNLSKIVERMYALESSSGMHAVATDVLRDSGVVLIHSSVEGYHGQERFDCVISHLCAQAVSDLNKFLRSCVGLLENDGRLIFSIPHPCFWNDYQPYFESNEFDYTAEQFANATLTISLDRDSKMPGIPFHHRPLSRYIRAIVASDLQIRRFDEIFPTEDVQRLYPTRWKRPHFCVFQNTRS